MAPRVVGDFSEPDQVREVGGVRLDVIPFGDLSITRIVDPPGWRWSTDVKPIVGTESCQAHHVGVVQSGCLGVTLDDGTMFEIGPGQAFDIPPGHDGYTVGDEAVVAIEWVSATTWVEPW